jgi:tetratricopeptide (TPR) repeat protein
LANRGALRAAEGDPAGAVADLRAALALDPELVPAWLDLAAALSASARDAEAREAAARAAAQACRAPHGYPHGVGTGEALEWGVGRRGLLLVEGDALRLAGPAFYRSACRELAVGS